VLKAILKVVTPLLSVIIEESLLTIPKFPETLDILLLFVLYSYLFTLPITLKLES
jgi:hypothetical protein